MCFLVNTAYAQDPEVRIVPPNISNFSPPPIQADTIPLDSATLAEDSIRRTRPKGDIGTTINYTAKDSIITSVDSKLVQLYGQARIIFGEIQLDADYITIDYNTQKLHAIGRLDSTGRRIGFPIFKNGDEVYETRDIVYDFKTGQARIKEVVTEMGEGFIHGNTVFKNERDEILSINNTYTTCNLAHPHFRIRSTKSKAIPDDKIVSGPFNLEIMGVPTPLGLPFGMFPSPRKSASGIIMPRYGEEARRGFFLKDGGYFFDVNEYFKLRLTGEIYSKGSYGLAVNSNYSKRYRYNGSLQFSITKNRTTDRIEAPTSVNDYRISWNHSPQSRGTGKFSASVNAATATYTQNNYLGINYDLNSSRLDNTTRKLSSSVSFTKQLKGTPFSFGVSARHNQDITTKQVDLQLPEFYATMRSLYPFKNSKADALKKLNFRYNVKGTNRITNNLGRLGDSVTDSIANFDINNLPTFFENSKKGMRHTMPFSTSFKVLKHFNVSPSFNYEELWYFDRLDWGLNEDASAAVVIDTLDGFNRVNTYNTAVSINTRIYGTFILNKPKVQAIRHTINPAISYTYTPDFGAERFDYFQKFTLNSGAEVYKSRYDRYVFGSPRIGESQSIGISLGNTIEAKVIDRQDSTSENTTYKKVSLIRSLSMSTSYNMVADSFNLANISLRANTALFDRKVNISITGALDPYRWVVDSVNVAESGNKTFYQRRIDQLAFQNGKSLGTLNRATLSLSTNLNPKKREKEADTQDKIANSSLSEADKNYLLDNPDIYVDFDIPWSLRINYNLSMNRRGLADPTVTQSMTFSGDLSLSEKWKIGFRSGYDFKNQEFTQTNLSIHRDLHCWEMNMNWTPFGRFTSYDFVIRVKSSLLQDLKINRRRSFLDR